MTKPRLLIADDHKIFAEGLKRLLKEDFDIAGVVEVGAAAAGRGSFCKKIAAI